MFVNKRLKTTKKPSMVEPKVANPLIHVMDVNMAITKSKVIEEQVFRDRNPIKKKYVIDWEKE
jgi:hypothetical protein